MRTGLRKFLLLSSALALFALAAGMSTSLSVGSVLKAPAEKWLTLYCILFGTSKGPPRGKYVIESKGWVGIRVELLGPKSCSKL